MRVSTRLAVAVLAASAAWFATTAPASAVVDPGATLECLTDNTGNITAAVNPAAPGVPAKVPAANCLPIH
jgi:hypothetical protein